MKTRVTSVVYAAAAATVLGLAGAAYSAPLVWVKMEGSLDGGTTWSQTININKNETPTVKYRILVDMVNPDGSYFAGSGGAANGSATNTQGATVRTITSLTAPNDGLTSLDMLLFQLASDATQVSFVAGTKAANLESAAPPLVDPWNSNSSGAAFTSVVRASSAALDQKITGSHLGFRTALDPEQMAHGEFTILNSAAAGDTSLRFRVYTVGGVFRINGGANITASATGTELSTTAGQATTWMNGLPTNPAANKDPFVGFLPFTIHVSDGGGGTVFYKDLPASNSGIAHIPAFDSTAQFLAGEGPTAPVLGPWRAPSPAEANGIPKGDFNAPNPFLISDVVTVGGTTGPFVLQMSYDPDPANFLPGNEADAAGHYGHIQLALLDGTAWVPAEGAMPASAVKLRAYDPALDIAVGTWGVDLQNHRVWQVVDQSGTYAVVPEPATIGLLGLAAMGLTIRRRRHTA